MRTIKKKIKPLSPSLRERKRYLAFEIVSEQPIKDFNMVSGAISTKALEFMGEIGCADAGIMILPDKFNSETQRGLLKVNNKHLERMRAVLAMVEQVGGHRVILRSVGASGMINKAETYLAG